MHDKVDTVVHDMRCILYYLGSLPGAEGGIAADNFLLRPLSALVSDGMVEVVNGRAYLTKAGKQVNVRGQDGQAPHLGGINEAG